jgi:hypothetical protein
MYIEKPEWQVVFWNGGSTIFPFVLSACAMLPLFMQILSWFESDASEFQFAWIRSVTIFKSCNQILSNYHETLRYTEHNNKHIIMYSAICQQNQTSEALKTKSKKM